MAETATVRNLTHRYPNGRVALTDISFTVSDGECVALIGPNGAGKSTLFYRLAGILPGTPGVISIHGLDPATQKSKLPASVGILFQNPDDQLFCPTVFDDVAFGLLNLGRPADEIRKSVAVALESVGLTAMADRPPFALSGGEKRRAALASIVVMNPQLYLLDEPTAHLDPRGRREFMTLIDTLPGSKLIATHDLDFALDRCQRSILLDGGQLIADGPTANILGDKTLMDVHGLDVPWRLR